MVSPSMCWLHEPTLAPLKSILLRLLSLAGIGGLNGGLGASLANGSAASSMDALTQAYSGMQQYTASALPSLYGQSLLQQSVAGSQKEGEQLPSLLLHVHRSSFLNLCVDPSL